MLTTTLRMMLAIVALVTALLGTGRAGAQDAEIVLVDDMPEGVAFQSLAVADGSSFRFHIDAMYLHRITVDCGQVTGKIFGMEQITWVEYGEIEVRDWATGETIETLSAGDSYGPTADETSFFLASPIGRHASVFHFSARGAGEIGEELPDVTYTTSDCGSGAVNTMEAGPAAVTTLFAHDQVGDTMPEDAVFYVGLLTIEPGASIGKAYGGRDAIPYTANGSGVILPLVGGFGSGMAGQAGSAGPEVAPGATAWTSAPGLVALENFGPMPTTALLFGTLRAGDAIFMERHGDGGMPESGS